MSAPSTQRNLDRRDEMERKIKAGTYTLVEVQRDNYRSPVWNVFRKVANEHGDIINNTVFCQHCQHILRCHGNNTSSLMRHTCFTKRKHEMLQEDTAMLRFKPNPPSEDQPAFEEGFDLELFQTTIFKSLKNGVYTLESNRNSQDAIWTKFAFIAMNGVSGSKLKHVVCCRQCLKVLKYNDKCEDNLREHECQGNAGEKCIIRTCEKSDIQREKEVQRDIKEKLKNGVYKLMQKQHAKSNVWKLYALIAKDEKTLVKDYVYCTACSLVMAFRGKCTTNLRRHKCYDEGGYREGKEPREENSKGIPEGVLTMTPWPFGEQFGFAPFPTEVKAKPPKKSKFDFGMKVLQKGVGYHIKSGTYKINANRISNSPLWKVYGFISKEDGSTLNAMVCCRQCLKVLKYEGGTDDMDLKEHACYKKMFDQDEVSQETGNSREDTCDESDIPIKDEIEIEEARPMMSYEQDMAVNIKQEMEFVDEEEPSTSLACTHNNFDIEEPSTALPTTCVEAPKVVIQDNFKHDFSVETPPTVLNEAAMEHTPTLTNEAAVYHPYFVIEELDDSSEVQVKKEIGELEENEPPHNSLSKEATVKSEYVLKPETKLNITPGNLLIDVTTNSPLEDKSRILLGKDLEFDNKQHILQQNIETGLYRLKDKHPTSNAEGIWQIFALIEAEDGSSTEPWVYCRICHKLLRNLERKYSNLSRHACYTKTLKKVNSEDKTQAFKLFSNMLLYNDSLGLDATESAGFHQVIRFCLQLGAKYGENVDVQDLMPPKTELSQNLQQMAEAQMTLAKLKIKQLTGDMGCITIDWLSDGIGQRKFLIPTLHYCKEYRLQSLTLGAKSLEFSEINAKTIRSQLESLIKEFDLAIKVFVHQKDEQIQKALAEESTLLICFSSLLTQVLDAAIVMSCKLNEIKEAIQTILKLCKNSIELEFLKIPPKTPYSLFRTLTHNWSIIKTYLNENSSPPILSSTIIYTLENLVELCQKLEFIYKKLQESHLPSLCFVIPSLNRLQVLCKPSAKDCLEMVTFKANISQNLEKLWLPNITIWHKTAYFLYPPANHEQAGDLGIIKEFCLQQMLNIKQNLKVEEPLSKDNVTDEPSQQSLMNTDDINFFFPNLLKHSTADGGVSSPPNGSNAQEQLNSYIAENVPIQEQFDVMAWWQANTYRFPLLSQLALKILTIPASVKGEASLLPLAKGILNDYESSCMPRNLSNVLFLNSIRQNDDF